MVLKERRLWKQTAEEEIKEFVAQAYLRESENPCPVDKLRSFTDNVRRTGCGECVICREGVLQINSITESIANGIGRSEDFEVLDEISRELILESNCGYGKEIGLIAKDILDHEQEQFEKHIKRKRCDALVCKKYFSYYAAPEKCIGCNQCAESCELNAITGSEGFIHLIDPAVCNRCGKCVSVCGAAAIQKSGAAAPKLPSEPVPVGSFQSETQKEGGLMSQKRRRRTE